VWPRGRAAGHLELGGLRVRAISSLHAGGSGVVLVARGRFDRDCNAQHAVARGRELRAGGDRASAEQAFRLADELGSAEAAVEIGQLLRDRGEVDGAEAAFRRAAAGRARTTLVASCRLVAISNRLRRRIGGLMNADALRARPTWDTSSSGAATWPALRPRIDAPTRPGRYGASNLGGAAPPRQLRWRAPRETFALPHRHGGAGKPRKVVRHHRAASRD
jgi:hypothetical protein